MSTWQLVGIWTLVVAVAAGAHLFGRMARVRTADRTIHRRERIGVAVSNAGPLVVVLVGLLLAYSTGWWLEVALGTTITIIVVAVVGLLLAPG